MEDEMRKFTSFAMVLTMILVLTACGRNEHNDSQSASVITLTSSNKVTTATTNQPADDEEMVDYAAENEAYKNEVKGQLDVFQEIINIPSLIAGLEEEPDWSMSNFGSMDAFYDFCSDMEIPESIKDIYYEHKEAGTLNDRGQVEFWHIQKGYATYGSSFDVYEDKDGTIRASYIFGTYNAKKVVGQTFYRDKNDNLVFISVLTYDNKDHNNKTISYLPEEYTVLDRHVISDTHTGMGNSGTFYVDTALLDNKKFYKVMVCPEFTVIFYPETQEFLCVKGSVAIGPRVKVSNEDLEGLKVGGYTDLGILNSENTLVYPAILRTKEGTSFTLLHIAGNVDFKSSSDLHYVTIGDILYPIVNGNKVYYIEEARNPEYGISFTAYGFTNDNWLEWLSPVDIPIVINTDDFSVKEYLVE